MKYLGVEFEMKNTPALDAGFIPFGVWMDAYLKDAKTPIAIAIPVLCCHGMEKSA